MNTISRKLMSVLFCALTAIVAAGCASKADKMPATPDTSTMPATPDTGAMPAPPDTSAMPATSDTSTMAATSDTSTMAATSGTSTMPGTTDSKMPGTPDASKLPATPDSTKMPGTPDGSKMPATPDSTKMPGTPDGSKMQATPDSGKMPGAADLKLDGSQEVPPVTTTATGTGTITVAADRSVTGSIMTTDIEATAAHIHVGAAGANGPVIITLKKTADDAWAVPPKAKLTAKQLASYKAGNLYVNVHSKANPKGEIRVQLVPQ